MWQRSVCGLDEPLKRALDCLVCHLGGASCTLDGLWLVYLPAEILLVRLAVRGSVPFVGGTSLSERTWRQRSFRQLAVLQTLTPHGLQPSSGRF